MWPQNKSFAFSIFDDPDSQTLAKSRVVYSFLADHGLRTTIGVWPNPADPAQASDCGETCANADYVAWMQELQRRGFEIGFHNATSHTSDREHTRAGLDRFVELFGSNPLTMSNHYHAREGIYWGPDRLSGGHRLIYNMLTRGANRNTSFGHKRGDARFWGDLCKERIRYVRNFVFGGINTLKACPDMPYHDPERAYVNYWYASSDAATLSNCLSVLSDANQDQLEQEGGACILYAHFAHGFCENGRIEPRFAEAIRRLTRRNGWFVPVHTLLDHLAARKPNASITSVQRKALERRWLIHKARFGTS
jgi:hypothetical protein